VTSVVGMLAILIRLESTRAQYMQRGGKAPTSNRWLG